MKSIRDLGVVHVVTKAQGGAENASLQESIRLSARYASAIKLLQGMGVPSAEAREGDADSGEQALQQTEELLHQSQQLAHRLQAVEKEATALEPWGDFDPQNISRLQAAGYQIVFISVRKSSSSRNGRTCIMLRSLTGLVRNSIL